MHDLPYKPLQVICSETNSSRTENAVYSYLHLTSQFNTLLTKTKVSLTENTAFLVSPTMTFALRDQEQVASPYLHYCKTY